MRKWPLLLPAAMLLAFLISACVASISAPASADSYRGLEPDAVKDGLEEAGFTNVNLVDTDNTLGDIYNGTVDSVSIDGNSNFEEGQTFPADAQVVINCYKDYAQKKARVKPKATEESESTEANEPIEPTTQGDSGNQTSSGSESNEVDPEFKATVDRYEKEFLQNLEDMKVESKGDGPETGIAMLEYLQNSIGLLVDLGNQAVTPAEVQYLNDAINRIQQKANETTNANLSFLQSALG